jgi:aryl-alcohol dehydrogenase-like predicted oxidoreductase
MSFGSKQWRQWALEEAEALPFFRRAVELGINFFDTADMYSVGVSEEILGKALRQYANLDQCVVATKVFNPMSDGPNMQGLSRKHIQQGCEASLRRLGIETIDLYQIHRFDPHTPIDETLAALDLLVRQGKVRYIGASSAYAWQFAQSLALSDARGWSRFVSMQNHYNLLYREEEREMIPLCQAERIAVIPWSPLGRGLLARGRRSGPQKSATPRSQSDPIADKLYDDPGDDAVIEAVDQLAERRSVPPAQIALAWLLSKPAVTAPIIGATKLEHLDSAVAAVDLRLSADEIQSLESPYQPHTVRGM